MASEEKLFKNVDVRWTTDHAYTIKLTSEPKGSGELKIVLVVLQFFQFKVIFFQFKVKSCSFSLKSCSFSLKTYSVFHNTQLFIVQLQYPHTRCISPSFMKI